MYLDANMLNSVIEIALDRLCIVFFEHHLVIRTANGSGTVCINKAQRLRWNCEIVSVIIELLVIFFREKNTNYGDILLVSPQRRRRESRLTHWPSIHRRYTGLPTLSQRTLMKLSAGRPMIYTFAGNVGSGHDATANKRTKQSQ